MEKLRQIVAVVFAIAAMTASAAGCGDGEGSESESASTPVPPSAPIDRPDPSAGDAASERDRRAEGSIPSPGKSADGAVPPAAEAAAERDSGGGAERYRVPGGDNSIQTFGEEAGESERHAAAVVLHAFLQTRGKEQWEAVCSYLSASVHDQLRQLAPKVKDLQGDSCEETLAAISLPLSGAAQAEFMEADVGSLRVEGDRAFLLYRGVGDTIYAMTMAKEAGAWKVAALTPVPLS